MTKILIYKEMKKIKKMIKIVSKERRRQRNFAGKEI